MKNTVCLDPCFPFYNGCLVILVILVTQRQKNLAELKHNISIHLSMLYATMIR